MYSILSASCKRCAARVKEIIATQIARAQSLCDAQTYII